MEMVHAAIINKKAEIESIYNMASDNENKTTIIRNKMCINTTGSLWWYIMTGRIVGLVPISTTICQGGRSPKVMELYQDVSPDTSQVSDKLITIESIDRKMKIIINKLGPENDPDYRPKYDSDKYALTVEGFEHVFYICRCSIKKDSVWISITSDLLNRDFSHFFQGQRINYISKLDSFTTDVNWGIDYKDLNKMEFDPSDNTIWSGYGKSSVSFKIYIKDKTMELLKVEDADVIIELGEHPLFQEISGYRKYVSSMKRKFLNLSKNKP